MKIEVDAWGERKDSSLDALYKFLSALPGIRHG